MQEDVFSINSVARANLDLIAKEQSAVLEARACELSFIANEVAAKAIDLMSEGLSVLDFMSLLADQINELSSGRVASSDVLPQSFLRSFLASAEGVDAVLFVKLLAERLSEMGVIVSETDFLPPESSAQTFTYVRNALADEAYDVFSQDFDDPRVFYSPGFKEACVAVADGKCGYCILPFEERGGVRVPIISDLASRLDLKISAVTPVFGFEGTADMKYALLKRGFVIPPRDEDTDRYLELKLDFDTNIISRLLPIAESLGADLYRINTLGDFDGAFVSLILRDRGEGFAPILSYLTLFCNNYVPIGIYKNLE